MTEEERSRQPSEVIAERLKQVRNRRGLSVAKLAERCAELGMPKLNRDVITNIEVKGRRSDVGVGELFGLAYALDVPPADLLISTTSEPLGVAPQVSLYPSALLEWLKGTGMAPEWTTRDPAVMRRWFESNGRLRLLEKFQRAAVWNVLDGDDEGRVTLAFADFAELVNEMIEGGVFPPPLPAQMVVEMRARGLRYADQMRVLPAEDGGES
jgi:transcriptional regulator with XRE-family HTH domain